jgi:tRNA A-37 threonylcarbamoyl transferase component Bud32
MQAVTGPGRVVAGRYRLLDRVGQGAMGTVWRARDLVLTRDVAIKQVRLPEMMTAQECEILRERTLREARVSAKLSHPGVVTVHDVIEADGSPWIVMELVAARSLDQVLAQDGPLPPQHTAETGVMLLGALAAAHAAGIVHRDVKPANVLVTANGRAVLTDFGIATLDGDPGLTQAGMVMGTPGFCAPERIRGEPASPASDLWSLGATLYAAVEGHGPYDSAGSPMAVLASIVHSEPPPTRLAGPLGTVISALLDKDPERRPDAACALRLLADAATPAVTRARTAMPAAAALPGDTGTLTVAGGAPAGADQDGADPTARTWPTGFPTDMGSPADLSSPALPRSLSPAVHLPRKPADSPPPRPADSLPPSPADSLPPSPAMLVPASPGVSLPPSAATFPPGPAGGADRPDPAGGPVVNGTTSMPWLPGDSGPPGRPGHRGPARASSRRRERVLALVIAGIAIVCAGLLAGVLVSRAMGGSGQAPSTSGTGHRGAGAAGAGAPRLPAGYHWYSQPAATRAGFSVAAPDGWQVHRQAAATTLRDPASAATITITPGAPGGPGPLREAQLLEQAGLSLGSYPGYHRIAISPFFYRGTLAAGWRFAYRQPGAGTIEALDVVTRLATPAGQQPYELMVTAPPAQWQATRRVFGEVLRTFSPHT